jgi:hypothetical protein
VSGIGLLDRLLLRQPAFAADEKPARRVPAGATSPISFRQLDVPASLVKGFFHLEGF